MATKAQTKAKTSAKKAPAKAASTPKRVREPIEKPSKATFETDDKRAQYARLVVFNYARKNAKALKVTVGKDVDVNSVSNSVLSTAAVALAGGNELQGAEGLELISSLTKAGATDPKVADRGLTKAYAAEVRPFLRRARLAPAFSRRSPGKAAKAAETNGTAEETPASTESE